MPGSNVPEAAWDGFLTGPENALALASASALAKGESLAPSILILHGPAGVGKTRLLAGLLAERLERRPGDSAALVTGEAFASACSEADTHPDGWPELRARFRDLDFLAIDDIHGLERNVLALNELMHTLDVLEARGAAVAVTAKLGPGQWDLWPNRLVNRFLGGLSVKIEPPSLMTRRRYLLDRARAQSLNLTADAVELLAEAADGFRTLNGWLSALKLAARLERKPLNREFVEPFLSGDTLPTPPSIETIARAVAARFRVSLRDLRGTSRRSAVVEPRHFAIYLAREHLGLSYAAIGAYFGKRDPKTIRHACQAAAERLGSDPSVSAAIEAVRRSWTRSELDNQSA